MKMENIVVTLYLDESGFTGNNLLDTAQPIFVFGSVKITPAEAANLVASISGEFGLKALELKGSRLLRYQKGQKVILKILSELKDKFRFIAINKRYAAACRVFDYLVEPAISDCHMFFFEKKLHYYVADGIYSLTKNDSNGILAGLSSAMRERNPEIIFETLKEVPKLEREGDLIAVLKEIVVNNRSAILDEFNALQTIEHARWLMDLSSTSLFSLLGSWSREGVSLDVHCDESKPLTQFAPELRARIGAKHEILKMPLRREVNVFALANEIRFEDSKVTPGLQLADIVAGAANFAINNPKSEFSVKAGSMLYEGIDPSSVFPYSQQFTSEELLHLGDLLVIIAKAQLHGMSPCERLRYLFKKSREL